MFGQPGGQQVHDGLGDGCGGLGVPPPVKARGLGFGRVVLQPQLGNTAIAEFEGGALCMLGEDQRLEGVAGDRALDQVPPVARPVFFVITSVASMSSGSVVAAAMGSG